MKLAVHRVVHHPMREVPSERLGVPNPIAIMAPAPAQMRVAQIAPKERTFIFKSFVEWFRICYLNYLGARNQDFQIGITSIAILAAMLGILAA